MTIPPTMQTLLVISTLLGGATALWFLWDKRFVIAAWFKIKARGGVNLLSLGDEEFTFLSSISDALLAHSYLPVNSAEEEICKSLVNSGVLAKRGSKFRLTRAGRRALA